MPFVPVLAMLALIIKLVDTSKFLSSRNWASALTQVYVWIAGVVVVLLFAQTEWAGGIPIGDSTLASLNFWALLALGLTVGSGASVVNDVKNAVDPTLKTTKVHLLKLTSDSPIPVTVPTPVKPSTTRTTRTRTVKKTS